MPPSFASATLGIILLHWKDTDRVVAMVEHLQGWNKLKPLILVVDNASHEEGWDKISQTRSTIKIRNRENLGFAGGNNVGIQAALDRGCKHLLLLNSDVGLEEGDVTALLAYLEQSQACMIGPVIREVRSEGTYVFAGGRDIALYTDTRIPFDHTLVDGPADVDYIPGMVVLMNRSILDEIGLLDANYFFSGEMADLCHRARKAGHHIGVDRDVAATHHANKDGLLRKTLYRYYSLRNRFLFIRKHHSSNKLRLFLKWSISGSRQWVALLLTRRRSEARAIRLALVHGWMGSFGNKNDLFIQ